MQSTYDNGFGNYIVIEDVKGYTSKYAHLDERLVSRGDEVSEGDIIGLSGNTGTSTGSHLHIELMQGSEYLNPYFFLEGYGTNTIQSSEYLDYEIPTELISDSDLIALITEAEKYLGYPYVLGGSSPS